MNQALYAHMNNKRKMKKMQKKKKKWLGIGTSLVGAGILKPEYLRIKRCNGPADSGR
jgi:hypothetical protein